MADGGEDAIVIFRRQVVNDRATCHPSLRHFLDVLWAVFWQRRQNGFFANKKIVNSRIRPIRFTTGDRMPRDELADFIAKCLARGSDNVGLGASRISDDGMVLQVG